MTSTKQTVVAVIAARNEAQYIGRTLERLQAAVPPPDAVVVIADQCSDDTAVVAQRLGAQVFERRAGPHNKGAALQWLFAEHGAAIRPYPVVAVFDADSIIDAGFFAQSLTPFDSGARVVQSGILPIEITPAPVAMLAAYSNLLMQHEDGIRARLGGSVRLRGSGMVFETALLAELLGELRTVVEDIELTVLLAARGIRIAYAPKAIVYEPQPANLKLASNQRARWLWAQADVLRKYPGTLTALFFRGPLTWWLLQSLFLKPRTLLVSFWGLLLILALAAGWPGWIAAAFGAFITLEAAYCVLGLGWLPAAERWLYARAICLAPIYLFVWWRSLITALLRRGQWLSARTRPARSPDLADENAAFEQAAVPQED